MAARNESFQRGNAPALIFQLDRIRGKAPVTYEFDDGRIGERERVPVRGKINNYN